MVDNIAFVVETEELLEETSNFVLLQNSYKTSTIPKLNFLKKENKRVQHNAANFENQIATENAAVAERTLEYGALVDEVNSYMSLHKDHERNLKRIVALNRDLRKGFVNYNKMKADVAMQEVALAKAQKKGETMREQHVAMTNTLTKEIEANLARLTHSKSECERYANEIAELDMTIETINAEFTESCCAQELRIEMLKEQVAKLDADFNYCAADFVETKQSLENTLSAAHVELKCTLVQLEHMKVIECNYQVDVDAFQPDPAIVATVCEKMSQFLQTAGLNVVVTEGTLDDYLRDDFRLFKQMIDANLNELSVKKARLTHTKIACEQQLEELLNNLRMQKGERDRIAKCINVIQEGFARKRTDVMTYHKLQGEILQMERRQTLMLEQAMMEKADITLKHDAAKQELSTTILKAKQQYSELEIAKERKRAEFEAQKRSKTMELEQHATTIDKLKADHVKLLTGVNTLKAKEKKQRRVTFSNFDRVYDDCTDSMISDEKKS